MNGKKLLKEKEKKVKKKSISQLKKELDKYFSIYIRQRDKGRCFTCGVIKDWKQQQCGHYISRQHLATRWDEINCNCQCVGCNVFRHGNMDEYALKLQAKYGDDVLKGLNGQKRIETKLKEWEMVNLIDFYKKQCK